MATVIVSGNVCKNKNDKELGIGYNVTFTMDIPDGLDKKFVDMVAGNKMIEVAGKFRTRLTRKNNPLTWEEAAEELGCTLSEYVKPEGKTINKPLSSYTPEELQAELDRRALNG
jgi:hypothetical protein